MYNQTYAAVAKLRLTTQFDIIPIDNIDHKIGKTDLNVGRK